MKIKMYKNIFKNILITQRLSQKWGDCAVCFTSELRKNTAPRNK